MIVFIACILLASCGREVKVELPATNPYGGTVVLEETFRGVPVRILDKLIQSESSWRYTVIHRSEYEVSVGLAQVNLKWLPYFRSRYGIEDPANPWQSLVFAADYLRDLYQATGSWEDAIVAYKVGLLNIGREPGWVRVLAKRITE